MYAVAATMTSRDMRYDKNGKSNNLLIKIWDS